LAGQIPKSVSRNGDDYCPRPPQSTNLQNDKLAVPGTLFRTSELFLRTLPTAMVAEQLHPHLATNPEEVSRRLLQPNPPYT